MRLNGVVRDLIEQRDVIGAVDKILECATQLGSISGRLAHDDEKGNGYRDSYHL